MPHRRRDGIRVYPDDRLEFTYIASAAPTSCFPSAWVEFDDGTNAIFQAAANPPFTTDRTAVSTQSPRFGRKGWLTRASVDGDATGLKRGQFFCALVLDPQVGPNDTLCQGYYYPGKGGLALGDIVEPGPGGGEGSLRYEGLATDVAGNVDTTITVNATNTRRRIHEIQLHYNAAAIAATRTITISIDRRLRGVPTGFGTAANAFIYTSPTLTMTTGEEGTIEITDEYTAVNDNGTITIASQATAPNPLPFDLDESIDTCAITIDVTLGEATDVYSATALIEEWLVI